MAESRFVYVIYIRAPIETVFQHLTDPALNKLFWGGYHQESSWRVGAPFSIVGPDEKTWDKGEVLAFDPPRHVSVTWEHQMDEAMKAEGASTATFDLEPYGEGGTELTLTHSIGRPDSKFIAAVSGGWPNILASLKSLLETGKALG
jgi:uncharacterized protein YndB with AHSA1/START domain